ncbi:hypothetical protein Molly5_114 [Maribacter phage Molly_5]|uniref:Uncharacterized protein n=2 Tax=Mollyvirus TaxID=2948826 RepID=A0A8E4UXS1_9CAUD|nr:hypothetical protein M1M29_gp113 [Maribacter phage Molly_1]YP_010357360.1 hypothetical protein M1M30_gp111 [Maribacter phage Colly_1]QQO97604.1 hypothetical protein Molly2_113 [Maribacter phage Molly_2]QQO97804.1 hypothetical protein Molly3_113 [Maribacter phage Molly_3]QQO98005.1 hypothetical protein Molly4_114 [Maribacter phage Molly_4]QQO98205.1 hypothetical protein Molly5_114 [Maribacter phage Molly_5]QQO97209.1 hypothetical protein Colly1_111 [Maribacter phage Colly_1]
MIRLKFAISKRIPFVIRNFFYRIRFWLSYRINPRTHDTQLFINKLSNSNMVITSEELGQPYHNSKILESIDHLTLHNCVYKITHDKKRRMFVTTILYFNKKILS